MLSYYLCYYFIKVSFLHVQVICEMATAAMALSVYKRFQAFPCIIQNNLLIFTRKADPKITQSKTVSAPQQPPEVSHPPSHSHLMLHSCIRSFFLLS